MRDIRLNLESRVEQRFAGFGFLFTLTGGHDQIDVHRGHDAVECRDVREKLRDLVITAEDTELVLVGIELLTGLWAGGGGVLPLVARADRAPRDLYVQRPEPRV